MTTSQPAPLSLPVDDWPGWLDAQLADRLAEVRSTLDQLRDGTGRDTAAVLELWNDADIALREADSLAGLLTEVHPDADLRTLAERHAQEVDRIRTDRGLDRGLYDAVAASDPAGLDPQAQRMREHVLRDFRRSGVDRDDETRNRLRAISERLTVLDQDFSRLTREDVREIRIAPERLAGLPQDFIDAHPAGDDGLVAINTDYPDYLPFRTFAQDAQARRELAIEFLNRGWPKADDVLHEMFDLRHEKAQLLGYDSWPAYDSEVKMVGTSEAIAAFIDKLADAARTSSERDRDVLLERLRRDDPQADGFDSSQVAYYTELVRREDYDVDAQEVRRYFDFAQVRQGLLDVTGRLFGVTYRAVDVATWHPDVTGYDVVDAEGVTRGRIYLDLHPRDGKYKHAAQFDLVGGITGRRLPEGVLVCNFSRGLMEHQHVVTLFHEFGHLVHHVLAGDQHWSRFSGVATEWDFVEAPSQMLEEWAWDANVLRTFARDADGTPIPAELVARMRAAKDFGKGVFVRNQLYYTAVSYLLHRDRPADLTAAVRELQQRYDVVRYLDGTHFHTSFGHLGGYSSAYYTYLWSLVIAKDLFSAFDADDLLASDAATRYRERILAPGGSKDAADLVEDFLGRPFTFDAFAAWLDEQPVSRN
ncbi:M3 family metallopeptidase [uncultured Jatrophihabitans sp.]|uniref:M3 family metallopeptidase n=1 Tax=uncultured Jatrophihabitans sp. TaxID=1610747 RepID=UPI0035CC5E5D